MLSGVLVPNACFSKLYAIGQIAKQLIFVSITPQESIPVRRNRRSCNHVLPLCVLRSLVDCFRMSVPDKIYSADSFKPRSDIRKKHLLGIGLLLKCSTSPGPDQLQHRPRPWHLSQEEYLLVVRTLLSIPLGPISIPVAVGPYQKCTEGTPDFHVQRNCRGCFA